jgi:hypothetical protein
MRDKRYYGQRSAGVPMTAPEERLALVTDFNALKAATEGVT